jgi:hypothetical protein
VNSGVILQKAPVSGLLKTGAPSLDEIQKRAFGFFWRESHPKTGLTKDRAKNNPNGDAYIVASTASTGYALAALPIGVERGWVAKRAAYDRALTTLKFAVYRLPNNHGFFYHFLDWRTGDRVWKCELSSIDSGLFILGALACGRYFKGTEVERLANVLYERMDWRWMQAGGTSLFSREKTLSMGWKPEGGWLSSRWYRYSEASFLYLLALGAPKFDLPTDVWTGWGVKATTFEDLPVLGGPGPLFMAQMTPGYFDLRGKKDRQGYDWWQNFENAHRADIRFCRRNPDRFKTMAAGLWGISASDQPEGYGALTPVAGQGNGTIVPTAFLAGTLFVPGVAQEALNNLWRLPERSKLWGRYGFANGINLDKAWIDPDVIGIDLGMMLLALENRRSGLLWRLTRDLPMTQKALRKAGMH